MKTVCALICLCFAVYVFADSCTNHHDCVQHHLTTCANHTHVGCTVDSGNGFCECLGAHTGQTCNNRRDCQNCPAGANPHCVNNHCHCGQV